jgi:hypothetical protein
VVVEGKIFARGRSRVFKFTGMHSRSIFRFWCCNSIQMGQHISSIMHGVVDGRTHCNVQVHDVSQCICLITFILNNQTKPPPHHTTYQSTHPFVQRFPILSTFFFCSNNILLSTFFQQLMNLKAPALICCDADV